MSFERVHRAKSQTPQTSWSPSQFAPGPFPVQEPKCPPTNEDIQNKDFQQNKFESFGLQLKEKYGTITPVEQERLGMLQAKLDSFWAQRMERAKAQPNLLEILMRNAQSTQATESAAPVQPKLTIGQPNDQYEQEADRVAEQVMSMASPATPNIQRQAEEEQKEVHTKPLVEAIPPIMQQQKVLEGDEPLQAKCESCEKDGQVQRSPHGVPQVQTDLESRLNTSKGGGKPLPSEVRSFMESGFDANFEDVRVHTDRTALQMNQELGAQAFTWGTDIYFGAGKAPRKDTLTAHELTHVVQQTSPPPLQKKAESIQTKLTIGKLSDRANIVQQGTIIQRMFREEGRPRHRPILQVGDTGPGVSLLQFRLNQAGFEVPVTARYNAATVRALRRFHASDIVGVFQATITFTHEESTGQGVGFGTWSLLEHFYSGDTGSGVSNGRLLNRGTGLLGHRLGFVQVLTYAMNGVEISFTLGPNVARRYRGLRPRQWAGPDAIYVQPNEGAPWVKMSSSQGVGADDPERENWQKQPDLITFYDSPGPNLATIMTRYPNYRKVRTIQNFTSWVEGVDRRTRSLLRLNEVFAWHSVVDVRRDTTGHISSGSENTLGRGWASINTPE